jgi:hypothetical protein
MIDLKWPYFDILLSLNITAPKSDIVISKIPKK